jgi:hypothetical protein
MATEIAHLPLSETSLRKSVTRLRGTSQPSSDFDSGYQEWREAEGGVFSLTVAEAVAAVEKVLAGAAT